jgi:hypothetical protein
MLGSVMLEVAIGLAFTYILLSLACSAAGEIAESWLKYRARDLERGIRELLAPSGGRPAPVGLVAALFDHALVSGLYRGTYGHFVQQSSLWRYLARLGKGPSLPSYIPARNFALALLDTIKPAAEQRSGALGATRDRDQPPPESAKAAVESLRAAVLADTRLSSVRPALLALVDAAENDMERVRENIETWFNNGMERVSGWYKRRAQTFIFLIGLALAVILNLDSLGIAQRLATDKPVRESLVAAATAYAQAASAPGAPPAAPQPGCAPGDARPSCRLESTLAELQDMGLPVGWDHATFWGRPPRDQLLHVFGWLLTALAASLGAPFWFDLLNKFVMLRSTLKPKTENG